MSHLDPLTEGSVDVRGGVVASDAVVAQEASELAVGGRHESRRAMKAAGALATSSVAATAIGLASTKAVAAIYGPRGTGTLGLLAGAYTLVALVLGLGVDQGGTKSIAETAGTDAQRHAVAVRTTLFLTCLLGAVGAATTIAAAPLIARLLTGKASLAPDIRILAIVVGLTIVSGGPGAYLHGTRQIKRFVIAFPVSSMIGTILTIVGLLVGINLVWSVLVIAQVVDTGTIIVLGRGAFTVARTPGARVSHAQAWRNITLGVVFVTGSVATTVNAVGMRVLITRRLGIDDTGFFQAGFAATSLASVFLLQAMTFDYYPRLAQTGRDDSRTNAVMTHQLELSLNMVAPLALGAVLFAPIGITVLYSGAYRPAVHIAQIFALGEFMRVVSWGIGFVLAVREAKRVFLLCQLLSASLPIMFSFALLPSLGLPACAVADVVTQALLLAYVLVAAGHYTGFRMPARSTRRMCVAWTTCLGAVACGYWSRGWVVQAALLVIVTALSVRYLAREFDTSLGGLGRRALAMVRR